MAIPDFDAMPDASNPGDRRDEVDIAALIASAEA